MKRTLRSLFAAILSFVPFTILAQTATNTAPATNGPPAATVWQIAQVGGTVQVKTNAAAAWTSAKVDQILDTGGSIHTGPDGKAILKASDIAGITMHSNTTIEVGLLTRTGDATKTEAKALSGRALFLVNKLKTQGSSFQVETPTAVVGVRGTAFSVKVADDLESSRVACYNGEVGVQGKGPEPGMVIVKEKMGTNVVKNKPPTPPEKLAEVEAQEWERVKAEVQTATPMAAFVPAIGGMIEMHQLQNAEAERILSDANRALKGNRKADADFKVFEAALAQYVKDTGSLPTKQQGLDALLTDVSVPGWKGPYLGKDSNMLDPYGRPYKWIVKKSPAGKDVYEVRSGGPDGIVNNDDDHVRMISVSRLQKLATEAKPAVP